MLDLVIIALLGREILRKTENSKAVKEAAAFTCNTIEGKPFNYDFLGKPLGRLFRKLEQSVKLCVTLTTIAYTFLFLLVSGVIFPFIGSVLHLLHIVVTDANIYNFLSVALIIIIAGICLVACSFGCVGGLFLMGHLQRWQNTRHAQRMEIEHASKNQ
jgi:hypothetical protein